MEIDQKIETMSKTSRKRNFYGDLKNPAPRPIPDPSKDPRFLWKRRFRIPDPASRPGLQTPKDKDLIGKFENDEAKSSSDEAKKTYH